MCSVFDMRCLCYIIILYLYYYYTLLYIILLYIITIISYLILYSPSSSSPPPLPYNPIYLPILLLSSHSQYSHLFFSLPFPLSFPHPNIPIFCSSSYSSLPSPLPIYLPLSPLFFFLYNHLIQSIRVGTSIYLFISPNHLLPKYLTPHVLSDGNVEWCKFEVCGVLF